MIHVAVLHLAEPHEGEDENIFASLDGEVYLPINRYPTPEDEEAIAALFKGDGNFRPMTWARRAMAQWWWGDLVTEVVHSTVGEEALER